MTADRALIRGWDELREQNLELQRRFGALLAQLEQLELRLASLRHRADPARWRVHRRYRR